MNASSVAAHSLETGTLEGSTYNAETGRGGGGPGAVQPFPQPATSAPARTSMLAPGIQFTRFRPVASAERLSHWIIELYLSTIGKWSFRNIRACMFYDLTQGSIWRMQKDRLSLRMGGSKGSAAASSHAANSFDPQGIFLPET